MQRIGRPAEVAAAVVWLMSDASTFVNGITLTIDGGKMAGMAPFRGRDTLIGAPSRVG